MYDFRKCVIGVAPTRRDMFRRSRLDEIMQKTAELAKRHDVDLVTIDGVTDEGLLVSNSDAAKVAKHFIANEVDAVFVPHANFGQEEAAAKLCASVNKPVLLWGPRDPAPLGITNQGEDRPFDVQCGLFATGKALLSYNVPFTYVENCFLDSPVIDEGFSDFARTVCAAKAFKSARVGQLSLRPRQFLTVKYNESELLEKFGIEVVPIGESEIVGTIKKILEDEQDAVAEKIRQWSERIDLSAESEENKKSLAASALGITRLAEGYGCTVLAGECWRMLRTAFGVSSCFLWGALTDDGVPVSCETDVLGAIGTGVAMGAARNDSRPFFADITIRHPTNDNAELLWHCGPFPVSLAKDTQPKPKVMGCKGQWEIRGGDVTVVRMGSLNGKYTMFADEAKGTDGPKTNGNYLWIETDNWPMWERKFVTGPYIHHVTGIHGKLQAVIHEALKYMGDIGPDCACGCSCDCC
ncbi:MAG: sugar isomerase [Oscillospiraceae bacterium]|nr:sugar isomerase [Oscillospiraceae bacterium]